MSYVNVAAEDLNIGDLVKGKGRVLREVYDHDTMSGHVVVVFEKVKDGSEHLAVLRSKSLICVRCDDGVD